MNEWYCNIVVGRWLTMVCQASSSDKTFKTRKSKRSNVRKFALPDVFWIKSCCFVSMHNNWPNNWTLLPTEATGVLFSGSYSVNTTAHEPLHLAWWNFARTCILTTYRSLLKNIKVIGQRLRAHIFVRFCLHDTCGQYLALSEGFTCIYYFFSWLVYISSVYLFSFDGNYLNSFWDDYGIADITHN